MATEHPNGPDREPLVLGRTIVNLMGPEGSGKSNIARRLSAETGKPLIVFGDIFRDLAANDPGPYGDECRAVFAEHRYTNPQILFEIIVQRFKQDDLADGFIIDGGMRTVGEIKGFQDMLDESGRSMPLTSVLLRVPGWMCLERLVSGENARKRDDDTVDGVLKRLSRYYDSLGERVNAIENQGWQFLQVDGTGNIDQTYSKVAQSLQAHL